MDKTKTQKKKPQLGNVFTNDGSFLERFKKAAIDEDKERAFKSLKLRQEFEKVLRHRGNRKKRLLSKNVAMEKTKKLQTAGESAYIKALNSYQEQLCTDESDRNRSLVK